MCVNIRVGAVEIVNVCGCVWMCVDVCRCVQRCVWMCVNVYA